MVDGPSVSSILASNWLSRSHVGLSLAQSEHSAPARGSGPLRGSIAVLKLAKSSVLLETLRVLDTCSGHFCSSPEIVEERRDNINHLAEFPLDL